MKVLSLGVTFLLLSLKTASADVGSFSADSSCENPPVDNPVQLFDKTSDIVTKKFYDQTFRNLNWPKLVLHYREKLNSCSSDEALEATVNDLLANLNASHTEFLSSSDQEYWGLKSVFSGEIDGFPVKQIGAWFVMVHHHWFVKNVFLGSPAAKAGLLPGDEIIAADSKAFRPVESFFSSGAVIIKLKHKSQDAVQEVSVTPVLESVQRSMLRASQESFKIIKISNTRVAYFHLWSGTHDEFKNSLKEAALKANQESDVLILDLRDGFGGASPEYLDPFFDHDSAGKPIAPLFSKPMVVLINNGVRSGKEWITDILKQTKRATLMGSRTKGYFLAGAPFDIKEGRFLLYLAVEEDPSLPKLEHNGVRPDIYVNYKLPYSRGRDPVLESAIRYIHTYSPFFLPKPRLRFKFRDCNAL